MTEVNGFKPLNPDMHICIGLFPPRNIKFLPLGCACPDENSVKLFLVQQFFQTVNPVVVVNLDTHIEDHIHLFL